MFVPYFLPAAGNCDKFWGGGSNACLQSLDVAIESVHCYATKV